MLPRLSEEQIKYELIAAGLVDVDEIGMVEQSEVDAVKPLLDAQYNLIVGYLKSLTPEKVKEEVAEWLFNWHKELHGVNIYPHKTWDTLTEESRGYYREDADHIVNAQRVIEVEEVKKILLAYYQANYYPNIRDDYAKEICQLFKDNEKPEPDENIADRTKLDEWGSAKGLPKGWRSRTLKG